MPKKSAKPAQAPPGNPWPFRLLAMIAVPLLALLFLELALRLMGAGYSTAFLVPGTINGSRKLVQNDKFGWRFFGPSRARIPFPICLEDPKPAKTVRIFVLGESAAFGDPQPRFGLSRMLEAMLSLRHPGGSFEVVNAAMTGINSNVILPIARDCAGAEPDIWVIYMGNNEVVGPFGAGTVFGSQAPPLWFIRAGVALKSTRIAELLGALVRRVQPPAAAQGEWKGMQMFLDQKIRADDPRLARCYRNFEGNLRDILNAGRRAGTGIVLSTVAVNLKDCAPFASLHRPGWTEAGSETDETFADSLFLRGTKELGSGGNAAAQKDFQAARDWDALRFRCDSRLNELIRKTAAGGGDGVVLADAEQALADGTAGKVPGADLFYDHVHFTFKGNYLLARSIAPGIEKLLAARLPQPPEAQAWPSQDACAKRLAWTDWDRQAATAEITARMSEAPFTGQLTHSNDMQRLLSTMETLIPATETPGAREAAAACRQALEMAPEDPWLHAKLSLLQLSGGDIPGATASARRVTELAPTSSEDWAQLGIILAQQQNYNEAADAFRRAHDLDVEDVWALENLAQSLEKLGRHEEAIHDYRRCLEIKPAFGLAWIGLGQTFEAMGRKAEADACYPRALANPVHSGGGSATLARFCVNRGWLAAAATNYEAALEDNPCNGGLHLEAARVFEALHQDGKAEAEYAEAVRWAPDSGQARFLYGLILGRLGKGDKAVDQFAQTVRLMPNLQEAKVNLGIALTKVGRDQEALAQFEEVLERNPTNALARSNARYLRQKLAAARH